MTWQRMMNRFLVVAGLSSFAACMATPIEIPGAHDGGVVADTKGAGRDSSQTGFYDAASGLDLAPPPTADAGFDVGDSGLHPDAASDAAGDLGDLGDGPVLDAAIGDGIVEDTAMPDTVGEGSVADLPTHVDGAADAI